MVDLQLSMDAKSETRERSGVPSASGGERRVIHRGRKFDFEIVTERTGSGKVLEREVVRHPGAVVVVPVLEGVGGRRVVLIRNYRVAVGETLYELPAGTIDAGESPRVCAARELREETGYEAERVSALGGDGEGDDGYGGAWFYTTPGLTDERMFPFVATGLREVGQSLEEDERIEVEAVGADEAIGMIARGVLRDGKSIVALLLAERLGLLDGSGGDSGGGSEGV